MNRVEVSVVGTLWESILSSVESRIGARACSTWIRPGKMKGIESGVLRLAVVNSFFAEWISEHYMRALNEAASEAIGRPVKVELIVEEPTPEDCRGNNGSQTDTGSSEQGTQHNSKTLPSNAGLNPNYTFDNFVVAGNNQLANAACLAVAERPGAAYNPLFIYAGSGLGKTHILQAVGHAAAKHCNASRIFYVSAERFMNELVFAIQQGTALAFRNKYRQAELLLIDDVHFLGGKDGTQEEFFHTFNCLHDAGHQIVLTCDRPPKEIPRVEERLISRFTWGLVVDIQKPDLETRIAILRKKASRIGFKLGDNVALAIARVATDNIRELEGSLLRIQAHAQVTGESPSAETALRLLEEMLHSRRKVASVDDVLTAVARHYGLTPRDLCGRKRNNAVALPRQAAMYLCRHYLDASLCEIGHSFGGRDHTTVLYACTKVEALLQSDHHFRRTLTALAERLFAHGKELVTH